jgi:hypothetical protein
MTEVAPSPSPLLFPFPSSGQVEMADCLTHSNGKPRILSVILIPASIFMVKLRFLSLYLSFPCVAGRDIPILASRGETETITTTGNRLVFFSYYCSISTVPFPVCYFSFNVPYVREWRIIVTFLHLSTMILPT